MRQMKMIVKIIQTFPPFLVISQSRFPLSPSVPFLFLSCKMQKKRPIMAWGWQAVLEQRSANSGSFNSILGRARSFQKRWKKWWSGIYSSLFWFLNKPSHPTEWWLAWAVAPLWFIFNCIERSCCISCLLVILWHGFTSAWQYSSQRVTENKPVFSLICPACCHTMHPSPLSRIFL